MSSHICRNRRMSNRRIHSGTASSRMISHSARKFRWFGLSSPKKIQQEPHFIPQVPINRIIVEVEPNAKWSGTCPVSRLTRHNRKGNYLPRCIDTKTCVTHNRANCEVMW